MTNTPELPLSYAAQQPNVRREVEAIAGAVSKLAVNSEQSLQFAAILLGTIKTMHDNAEQHRQAEKRPFLDAGSEVDAKFKPVTNWLKAQEDVVKRTILDYQLEEERKRREEQRKQEEEAEAERQRLIAMAEDEPDEEVAEKLVAQASIVVPSIVETKAPSVEGLSTRGTWKAEVDNPAAFIKYLAANPDSLYMGIVKFDQSALNRFAALGREKLNVPGIRAWEEKGLAATKSKLKAAPKEDKWEEE